MALFTGLFEIPIIPHDESISPCGDIFNTKASKPPPEPKNELQKPATIIFPSDVI